MSFEKGQVVQHSMQTDRIGVVVSNLWFPDKTSGTFLHGVMWVDTQPTYIPPHYLVPRDDISVTDIDKVVFESND